MAAGVVKNGLFWIVAFENSAPQFVFKICRASEWRALQAGHQWQGSPHDVRDGFIHLSTQAQVAGTLAKHFAGEADLVLLRITSTELGAQLRWEPSRGGELFPHLYGPLLWSMVTEVPFDDVLRGATSDRR
jgi:uncharacterized protein (DUF952 family)